MTHGRNSIALLLAAALLAGTGGCSRPDSREVVAIEKTRTYHRPVCAPVHMARTIVISVSEAKGMKFRPCRLCLPDSI